MSTNFLRMSPLALAMLWATGADLAHAQYQDSSAESARGFSNNRTQANISDQGSGYGPNGPYGPYYSRGNVNQNRQQNRSSPRQSDGLPETGKSLTGSPYLPSWYGLKPVERRTRTVVGVLWGEEDGRLVAQDVAADCDLSRAGLRKGDVLVTVDDLQVHTKAEWQTTVDEIPDGRVVPVVVRRSNDLVTLAWTPATSVGGSELPPPLPAGIGADGMGVIDFITAARLRPDAQGHGRLGVELDDQYSDRAIIKSVDPGSPAAEAGLRPADAILSVSGRAVTSIRELLRILTESRPNGTVEMYVRRAPELATPATGSDDPSKAKEAKEGDAKPAASDSPEPAK